jgi:hypothetical protein
VNCKLPAGPKACRQPAPLAGQGQVHDAGHTLLVDQPLAFDRDAQLFEFNIKLANLAFLPEEAVDLLGLHEAVASGDNEGNPPPASADYGRQLVFQGAELERVIPLPSPGVVRLGGDQVTARDQFVSLDGGVVVDGPLIILEDFGVVLDTNN